MAFLPATVLSIVVCYLAVRWLYPPEVPAVLPGGSEPPLAVAFPAPGAWTQEQKKTLAWMILAIVLWATDFLHHLDPACIAIGVGLGITFPHVGVLDIKAFKQTNFLLIFFIAGALSMSRVLADTHAIDILMGSFTSWTAPLLTNVWSGSMALYWSAFLYHFGFAGDQVLTAATLSPVLGMAKSLGYNPATIGLLWTFATGAKLFVYQSAVIAVAATYIYFDVKAFLKISAVMTVAQALILLLLVTFYWPLIGLSWRAIPEGAAAVTSAVAAAPVVTTDAPQWKKDLLLPVAAAPVVTPLPSGLYVPGAAALHTAGVSGVHLPLTWAQIERQPNQFDWRSLEQHPTFVSAVRAGKQVGLQVEIQGTAGTPAVPAWAQVPQLDVATGAGPSRRWPVVWSPHSRRPLPALSRPWASVTMATRAWPM